MRFVAAGCFVLVALAGCSNGSTAPVGLVALTRHFDSLTTVEAQREGGGYPQARLVYLATIANALAHGALPAQVTMTIAGASVTAHVVGVEVVDSGEVVDGNVFAVAWVDADADTLIAVQTQKLTDTVIDNVVVIYIGDSYQYGTPSPFTFAQTNTSAACANFPIVNLLVGPNPPCHLAIARMSFTQRMPYGTVASPPVSFGLAQLVPTAIAILSRHGL